MNSPLGSIRGAVAAALIAMGLGTAWGQTPIAPAAVQLTGAPGAAQTPGAPAQVPAPLPPQTAGTAVQTFGAAAPAAGAAPASPNSAAAAPSEDIRDIRGPKYIAPAWLWPAVIAGAALLAAVCYGIRRWLRRRRRLRPLLPFEEALQRLEEIRALMQPASAQAFSVAVSDIVRHYIEQRFDATATHRTTEEFLHDLLESSNPALVGHRGLLSEFLHQCDLVKFAGMSLSVRGMESLHDSARAFVLETAKPDETAASDKNAQVGEAAAGGPPAVQSSGGA